MSTMGGNNPLYKCINDDSIKTTEKGDIWISPSRLTVEWLMKNKTIRKFRFDSNVIKAGFMDFQSAKNCLVIILKDLAHVYYLTDGNSKTVSFPFPIKNAFWFQNVIILQRQENDSEIKLNETDDFISSFSVNNDDVSSKYITLTDPMSPFGFITFSNNEGNNKLYNPLDLDILLTPEVDDNSISVVFDNKLNCIFFFHTKVLKLNQPETSSHKNEDLPINSIYGSHLNENSNNALRKPSSLTRQLISRSLSKSEYNIHTGSTSYGNNIINNPSSSGNYKQNHNLDSPIILQNNPQRTLSATLDRMTNFNSHKQAAIDFTPSSGTHLQTEFNLPSISSKDIVLTKISSLTLPENITDDIYNTQFIPLKFEDYEAFIIFNKNHQYIKLWSIKMNGETLNLIHYRMHDISIANLVNFIDIDTTHKVDSILAYYNNNVPGSFIFTNHNDNTMTIYNPFVNGICSTVQVPSVKFPPITDVCFISSEEMYFNKFHLENNRTESFISLSLFPYPKRYTMKLYFQALRLIFPIDFFISFVFYWQEVYNFISVTKAVDLAQIEFESFFFIFKILLEQTNIKDYPNLPISQPLLYMKNTDLSTLLPSAILGLHLLREELFLNVLFKEDVSSLGNLLSMATIALNWPSTWCEYYPSYCNNDEILHLEKYTSYPLDEPPSIFKSLFSITDSSYLPITPFISFSRLIERGQEYDEMITPRTFKILRLFESMHTPEFSPDQILNLLNGLNIKKEEVETYPLGILTPLKSMLHNIENNLSNLDGNFDVSLLSRKDLEKCKNIINSIQNVKNSYTEDSISFNIKLSKSIAHNYNQPKNIRTLLTEIVTTATESNSKSNLFDNHNNLKETDNGISLQENANLIFSQDRRFNNGLSLLLYYKPHAVPFYSKQSEYIKIINQKKMFAHIIFLRTCVSGIGLGAIVFATEKPLSTQKWIIPNLNLVSLFSDGTKVSLDKTDVNTDTLLWGEFHAGVSSGMRIFKKVNNINGSWISFNRPKELDPQYGGFLLGLGLNGHLKNLEEWHVYNYLSPKQTHVSIGLLLGMSVSMRGSMDIKLTKVLSVHVVALLPQRSNDLNINIEVQSAGLVGIGLLYQNSNNPKMSELLLSQITSTISINEEYKPNEGYRMAAGIAYGLINLNNYSEQYSNSEGTFVSQNMNYNVKKKYEATSKLIKIITTTYDKEPSWIPQHSHGGAIIALMFLHLRSNNYEIGKSIKVNYDSNSYVRPEYLLYTEWAYYMIMWDEIGESLSFIFHDLDIKAQTAITSDNLPVYSIISGRILAMGIKYSSTGDTNIKQILLKLLDKFLPFYQYSCSATVDFKLSISGINVLINILLISLSLVMCGTGDLQVFQRIKYLHETITGKYSDLFLATKIVNKNDNWDNDSFDVFPEANSNDEMNSERLNEDNTNESTSENSSDKVNFSDDENHYAKYMYSSLALGFLFLGSGQYAIKTSDNESIAYLIMSLLPNFYKPYSLQELKHFWCLSVEPRCLVIKDIETEELIKDAPIEIQIWDLNNEVKKINRKVIPCLLPDLRKIKSIKIEHPYYYPLQLNFDGQLTADEYFKNGLLVQLQKKHHRIIFDDLPSNENLVSVINDRINNISESIYSQPKHENISDILEDKLLLKNLTMTELLNNFNHVDNNEENSQLYSYEIMYSNGFSGDNVDYELELWRNSQAL